MRAKVPGASVRVNVPQLHKVAIEKGWVKHDGSVNAAEISRQVKRDVSVVSRVLAGDAPCSGQFIANLLLAAAPWDFHDLFVVDETGIDQESAA